MSRFISGYLSKISNRRVLAAVLSGLLLACVGCTQDEPEMAGYIPVDGGEIWFRLNGASHLGSRPAIIVIHGGPGSSHQFLLPYLQLADTYPVIFYDQLDSGNAERPGRKENWRVRRFVDEIQHLRNRLGLTEVVIAGHSWGGLLAAEYASDRPAGLRALILSSPLINTPQWVLDNQYWIDQLPAQTAESIRQHQLNGTTADPDYRAAARIFAQRHMCRRQPCPQPEYTHGAPALNRTLYEYMWGPSEFYTTGVLKNYDAAQRLPAIAVPTLMICGEFDEAMPRSCRRYARMISQAKTVIVPDAGHATLQEDKRFYLDTVRDFLAEALQ